MKKSIYLFGIIIIPFLFIGCLKETNPLAEKNLLKKCQNRDFSDKSLYIANIPKSKNFPSAGYVIDCDITDSINHYFLLSNGEAPPSLIFIKYNSKTDQTNKISIKTDDNNYINSEPTKIQKIYEDRAELIFEGCAEPYNIANEIFCEPDLVCGKLVYNLNFSDPQLSILKNEMISKKEYLKQNFPKEYKKYIKACPENNTVKNTQRNNSTELKYLLDNCHELSQFKNENYYQDMLQKLSTLKIALTDDSGKLTGGADTFQTIDCFTNNINKIYTIAYSADLSHADLGIGIYDIPSQTAEVKTIDLMEYQNILPYSIFDVNKDQMELQFKGCNQTSLIYDGCCKDMFCGEAIFKIDLSQQKVINVKKIPSNKLPHEYLKKINSEDYNRVKECEGKYIDCYPE